MQTRSLRKFHDALFAAKAPLLKECAPTFPLSSLVLPHTQLPFRESRQKRARPELERVREGGERKIDTQRLMAALPAARGLIHINMSGEVGSKETARRNGSEEMEIEGGK